MGVEPEKVLRETVRLIMGIDSGIQALGGTAVKKPEEIKHPVQKEIARFFHQLVANETSGSDLHKQYGRVKHVFMDHYQQNENAAFLEQRWQVIQKSKDPEEMSQAITEIWAPEVALTDEVIFPQWQLSDVKENPDPYKPEEVMVPLNAMYGLPEQVPGELPPEIKDEWEKVKDQPDEVFFDYDHPVMLFSDDSHHELISCLNDLNQDIAFEKQEGTFQPDFRLIVPVSVSVTHPRIDGLTGRWLAHILKEKKYEHLRIIILTEGNVTRLKQVIGFKSRIPAVFSVIGKYGNHFNVLKYFQLLLEKTDGIRASFKLDTDEGSRSQDLKKATGQTWFTTLCHPWWGAIAKDSTGREVYLGINEGEYINEKDIKAKGYAACLREPDVKEPGSYVDSNIFFNKSFAHARATALYNKKVDKLEDAISHPVVKGGGYGIDTTALKKFTPFTFSEVGRAEDQQFYLAGLAQGNAGIFTPDLRIAHYKQSAATTEHTTEVSRLVGDLYRLIIFQHIVGFLGVKERIDPMPGVFAGDLARAQAFFNLLYKSYCYFSEGKAQHGKTLYQRGLQELGELMDQIDSGKIKQRWDAEQEGWKEFVQAAGAAQPEKIKKVLKEIEI
jgi:hypothetical protein